MVPVRLLWYGGIWQHGGDNNAFPPGFIPASVCVGGWEESITDGPKSRVINGSLLSLYTEQRLTADIKERHKDITSISFVCRVCVCVIHSPWSPAGPPASRSHYGAS